MKFKSFDLLFQVLTINMLLIAVKISKELTELLCSALFEPNIQENAFLGSEFAGDASAYRGA